MSKNYSKVKKWYDTWNWSITRVYNAIGKNWITEDEFFTITGKNVEDYENEQNILDLMGACSCRESC